MGKVRFSKDEFVGMVTGGRSLTDVFRLADMPSHKTVFPGQYIRVPLAVYDLCWEMHERSLRLVEAMERVFLDGEHALVVSEGYDLGYNMPDRDLIQGEIMDFKNALAEFDPYAVREISGDTIRIRADQAVFLSGMLNYDAFIVFRLFDTAFNTDYLKPFTNFKNAGYSYQGATALQEAMDVLVGLVRVSKEIERQTEAGRHKKDWISRIARDSGDMHPKPDNNIQPE